ncbi:type-F conjugative transfer system secretin TraK (plasmid) [Pseudomonas mandelii]|uniref:TraK domain-containing protein n=1 Tax=Pseudomonas mandelii TaxID=75612 RepID=UPI00398D1E7D
MNLQNNFKALAAALVLATCSAHADSKLVLPDISVKKAETSHPSASTANGSAVTGGTQPNNAQPVKSTEAPKAAKMVQVTPGQANDLPAVDAPVVRGPAAVRAEPIKTMQEILIAPGVNTIIPVALSHLNRIVTPFENPIVQTVTDAETKVVKNIVYVSTTSETPVAMYITPKDDESLALSVTLAPQKIPPIEANLILDEGRSGQKTLGGQGGRRHYSGVARKWEESQPYMDSIRGIMRAIALNKLPKGYSLSNLAPGDTVPACYQDGLDVDFSRSQVMLGHNFQVLVAVASNTTNQPLLVDETACTHPNLAAASVWPNNLLEPGMKTEIYIVLRVGEEQTDDSQRPSLLN